MAAVAVLDATTKIIRVRLGEASTTKSTALVSYVLKTASTQSFPHPVITELPTTTADTTIAQPASSGDAWVVSSVIITNRDNISHTYTVEWYDGALLARLATPFTVAAGAAQVIVYGGGGGGSSGGGYYQTLQTDNTDRAQRSKLDLISGNGISLSFADDSGNDRSKVTINSAGGSHGANCRLSGSSTDPYADVTAATSVYLHPIGDGKIDVLVSGVKTTIVLASVINLSLSGFTASKGYDIWVYSNAGTLTLDKTIWTSDSARATAIDWDTTLNFYVKHGDTDRRLVASIYIDSGGGAVTNNTGARNIQNAQNMIPMEVTALIGTTEYTTTSTTFTNVNGNSTLGQGKVSWFQGIPNLKAFEAVWNIALIGHNTTGQFCNAALTISGAESNSDSNQYGTANASGGVPNSATLSVFSTAAVGYRAVQKQFKSSTAGSAARLTESKLVGTFWG